ncbi:MAG: hypothetical protein RMJ66_04325 [Bacteroidia bacterium]|nr:hypothetical protein [Bacteroidia bacterium]
MSIEEKCEDLLTKVAQRYGNRPSIEALLFLIGLNELGFYPEGDERRVKADLIHLGTLVLLERAGYARRVGEMRDRWPKWELSQNLPAWSPQEEENFLREAIIQYYAEIWSL